MSVSRFWLAVVLGLSMSLAHGSEEPRYDRIHFQVERSLDVDNDRMQVMMSAQAEADDPARLARTVNQTMEWALSVAGDREGMQVRTGNYQTYPVRDKEKVVAWRGSQDLIIQGEDIPAISALVGELQSRLQVKSMGFTVSDEARRRAEETLIETVLEAFRDRARHVQRLMNARNYRLVDASIQTGGQYPGPVPMLRAQAAYESSVPAVQAGQSQVSVTVSGSIELVMP